MQQEISHTDDMLIEPSYLSFQQFTINVESVNIISAPIYITVRSVTSRPFVKSLHLKTSSSFYTVKKKIF